MTLAIIADGTFTRLEKILNNEFQYVSYSIQKSTNLINHLYYVVQMGIL
jgi:hypothetical protein